jgi:hypothetical protein
MNMILAITLGHGALTSDQIFDRISAAHLRMKSADVSVVSVSNAPQPAITVSMSPAGLRMLLPNRQVVSLLGSKIAFYESIFDEQTSQAIPPKVAKVGAFIATATFHREAITFLLDPLARREVIKDFRKDKNWKVSGNSVQLINPKSKLETLVSFDASYRVTRIKSTVRKSNLIDWRYAYDVKPVPNIPANAVSVKGFVDRPVLPTKIKTPALETVYQMWASMARFRRGTVNQDLSGQKFVTIFGQNSLEERSKSGFWSLKNGVLEINAPKRKSQKLKGKISDFQTAIARSGIQVSPFARYSMNRSIPYLDIFRSATAVDLDGALKVDSVNCKILKLTCPSSSVRMYVGQGDGRLYMVSSDIRDAQKTIQGARLKITYR